MLRKLHGLIFLAICLSYSSAAISQEITEDFVCAPSVRVWQPSLLEVTKISENPVPKSFSDRYERRNACSSITGLYNWHFFNGTETTLSAAKDYIKSQGSYYKNQSNSAPPSFEAWKTQVKNTADLFDKIPKGKPLNPNDFDQDKYTHSEVLEYRKKAIEAWDSLGGLWANLQRNFLNDIPSQIILAELHESEFSLAAAEDVLAKPLERVRYFDRVFTEDIEAMTGYNQVSEQLREKVDEIRFKLTIFETRIALLKSRMGDPTALVTAEDLLKRAYHPAFDTALQIGGDAVLVTHCGRVLKNIIREKKYQLRDVLDFCGRDRDLPYSVLQYFSLEYRFHILTNEPKDIPYRVRRNYYDSLAYAGIYGGVRDVSESQAGWLRASWFGGERSSLDVTVFEAINSIWLSDKKLNPDAAEKSVSNDQIVYDRIELLNAIHNLPMEMWPNLWRKLAVKYLEFDSYISDEELDFKNELQRRMILAQIDEHDRLFPFDKIK